jgi:hypothetical protein
MLKIVLALACVFLLTLLAHTRATRPVRLLDYERTTDDRTGAYVMFQSSMERANESRAELILEYFDSLEVMGMGAEARGAAIVAAYLPNNPPAALSDASVRSLVKAGALKANLLEDTDAKLDDGKDVPKQIMYLCCGLIALKAKTALVLQGYEREFPHILAFWKRALLQVDTLRVYAKWPIFGLKQCTYAHARRSERLIGLTERHARRMQGIMRPPRKEMVVSIDDYKTRIVGFPIDVLEWRAMIGKRLVALKKQRSMGMPPLTVDLLNLYADRCATGYNFEDKPLLMLETVEPENLFVAHPQPTVPSSRTFPHERFSPKVHVHEILTTGCTTVSVAFESVEEMSAVLLRELFDSMEIEAGRALFGEVPNLTYKLQHRAVGQGGTKRLYTDAGLLAVFSGDFGEFTCRRMGDEVIAQTSADNRVVVAGEMLAMMAYYGAHTIVAALLSHTVLRDTTLSWMSITPKVPFSVRGFSVEALEKNIRYGRPYALGPW